MGVLASRRPPVRLWRIRLLFCRGFLASPVVVTALLLVLSGCTAASKGLPESKGAARPSPHGPSRGESVGGSGSGATNRRKRDRSPSSARPVPASRSDHDRETRREPATPTAAAAAEQGRRRRPPAAAAAAEGGAKRAPGKENERGDASLGGLELDSDSGDELDDFSWSDDGRSDDGYSDGGWSDDDGDEGSSDWGRGAAGGPGGGGGKGWAGRRQAANGGRGAGGAAGTNMMGGMSNLRSRLNKARQRASRAYREAKSLMSSEMEGVVLKATRPDDLPVKPKHLEALMRPTAEMPKEFNVYLPVVRKLWSKMSDKEWRVAAKALYILHRFAADGSIEHASNLKESVAVLRTHHDSRRKVSYFDMDTICDVSAPSWSGEDVAPMRGFLRGYADFVLRRTTQFGPGFAELLDSFAMLAGGGKLLASVEGMVAAGSRCSVLGEEQEGAVTVAAVLQVTQDIRDVVEVCAAQLDYLARELEARSAYPEEVARWYAFLYENLEPVEALIRRTNELAERHKLSALRPLAAAPIVLKLRDEEVALEKQAALKAEQRRCSVDEGEEKPGSGSHGKQAGAAGLKAAGGKEAAARGDGGGGGGGSEGEDQAMVNRRQQGVEGHDESAPSPSPAGAPREPAGIAAVKEKVRSVKGRRKATGAKASSSSSAADAASPKSTTSEGGGVARQPPVLRPSSGMGTGAAAAGAAAGPQQEDGAKPMSSQRAGASAKSRAPKKKRPPSSVSGEAQRGKERPAKPSSGTGGVKRGANAGSTAAGGSGSGSGSGREQRQRVRDDSSVPKERKRKLSPRSEKPPR